MPEIVTGVVPFVQVILNEPAPVKLIVSTALPAPQSVWLPVSVAVGGAKGVMRAPPETVPTHIV